MKKLLLLMLTLNMVTACASKYDKQEGVYALLDTSLGEIVIKLDIENAPISVNNFVTYAENGFYNGTVFHRVIPGFMIQAGGFDKNMDRKSAGLMAPIKNEWRNGLKNKKYTIAMARTSEPDSATSQFFINVNNNMNLDQPNGGAAYAVFGEVVEGKNIVDNIESAKCIKHPKYPAGAVTPDPLIIIKSVTIAGKADLGKLKKLVEVKVKELQKIKDAELNSAIEKLEKDTGKKAKTTASGLKYIEVKIGSGAKPTSRSAKVTVHYEGSLLNGTVFDSSYKRGEPIQFPLNGVIAGWTEGVSMMTVGSTWYLIIPPGLGYGARGAGNAIPPNSWLIFKVELISAE